MLFALYILGGIALCTAGTWFLAWMDYREDCRRRAEKDEDE